MDVRSPNFQKFAIDLIFKEKVFLIKKNRVGHTEHVYGLGLACVAPVCE